MTVAIMRVRAIVLSGLLFLVAFIAGITVGYAQVPVTTWHFDNAHSGANTNEMILTPKNVNRASFGKLFTQSVDGAVTGQALYLPSVSIPNLGVHNVVYVATMHNSRSEEHTSELQSLRH